MFSGAASSFAVRRKERTEGRSDGGKERRRKVLRRI